MNKNASVFSVIAARFDLVSPSGILCPKHSNYVSTTLHQELVLQSFLADILFNNQYLEYFTRYNFKKSHSKLI